MKKLICGALALLMLAALSPRARAEEGKTQNGWTIVQTDLAEFDYDKRPAKTEVMPIKEYVFDRGYYSLQTLPEYAKSDDGYAFSSPLWLEGERERGGKGYHEEPVNKAAIIFISGDSRLDGKMTRRRSRAWRGKAPAS